jgi:hypothetical protein
MKVSRVWVDALCINQQVVDDEKPIQISRMKDIYHRAEKVCVWLGPHEDGSEEVMNRLELEQDWSSDIPLPWAEARSFFERSYWGRVWMVQEIALASHVVIMCGDSRCDWLSADALLRLLNNIPELNGRYLDRVNHLSKARRMRLEGHPTGFLTALSETRNTEATCVQDKAFAVHALSYDGTQFFAQPDYTGTENEVCLAISKSAILQKKSLDLIFLGAEVGAISGLASWIPAFFHFDRSFYPVTREYLAQYISGEYHGHRAGHPGYRWNTTNGSVATKSNTKFVGTHLKVKAHYFGTINALAAALADTRLEQPQMAPSALRNSTKDNTWWVREISAAYSLYDPNYQDHKDRGKAALDVWWHDVLLDRYEVTRKYDLDAGKFPIKTWKAKNADLRIGGKDLRARSYTATTVAKNLHPGQSMSAHLRACLAIIPSKLMPDPELPWGNLLDEGMVNTNTKLAVESCDRLIKEGLRLMTTEDDQVGWAHPAARLGDQLFLIEGCSMPAILRQCDDGYLVVGHSYVHGVMSNELWSRLYEEDFQTIVLC